nr:MAG TPA: hypothetical protein [Caudoviricetes sp.]
MIISTLTLNPVKPSSSSVYFSPPIATNLRSMCAKNLGVLPPGHNLSHLCVARLYLLPIFYYRILIASRFHFRVLYSLLLLCISHKICFR